MMHHDRFGNKITAQSGGAVQHYVAALDYLFCMRNEAREEIDQALALDPEFALAHALNARIHFIEGDPRAAVQAAETANNLADRCNAREQRHVHLTLRVTRNDMQGLLDEVLEHAKQYPRDALPLSYALGVYGLYGFGGFVDHHERQVALLESVAPAWEEDWWMLSWLGWSYVEVRRWEEGIPLLDRALALRPDNANAAHGRAHGHYESGDAEGAVTFINEWLPGYDAAQPLHCHIAWHLALTHLQLGDADAAHAVYNRFIHTDVSQALPLFTMIDTAAFAWRASLCGQPVNEAQQKDIAQFAASRFPQTHRAFREPAQCNRQTR